MVQKVIINPAPNIKTEEQGIRLNELLKIQSRRHDAIVRFANEHEDVIKRALEYAISKDVIDGEKDHYSEDVEEVTIEVAFADRMKQWQIANHKMVHFLSTGTEDTMFPPQRG